MELKKEKSCGCIIIKDNKILKKGKRNMWGSRIFKEAQTAEKRRVFRGTRRRIDRRRERINMLQSLIIEDIEKQYPNFFPMLRETSLDYEDKNISEKILGKK